MDDVISNLRDKTVQASIKSLMIYSITILVLPLSSMFVLKRVLFEDYFGYSSSQSMMYSAIVAVVLVHVILVFWIISATADERTKKKED
ncbi:VMA21-like domain protein [Aphelenchoides bicaudatus]|nr:VMA21-like domain protein [Aphelenchoides bicaudatus]